MEALGELFGFVSAIGDEISNIILGDGEEEVGYTPVVRPVVIAGPSGVGKGTLIAKLMKEYPAYFGFSVSHTTRPPREGEVDGVDYHFTDRGTMATLIEAGEFLESADVHGSYYGTSKAAVSAVTASGKICILDIDVQGVQSVKKANLDPSPMYTFINTPSMEELERRLRGRATESEEKIQRRLVNAKGEMAYAAENDGANFDLILVNDKLEETYSKLKEFLADNIEAVKASQEAAAAEAAKPNPAEESADSKKGDEVSAAPSIADQIAAKEAELEKANAAKDRSAAKTILAEIEALEAKLPAK